MIELYIENNGILYQPAVVDEITWDTERQGVPGKLDFKVLKAGVINFDEGNAVRLAVDGVNLFYGFVFAKKRDKEGIITVTAYDQLRYLKNKDIYQYTNKTASEVIKMLAADFNLQYGVVADTGYKIALRVESDKTLFDIIQTALDLTLQNKKQMFVLYDDFGKLTLKNISDMKLNCLLAPDTAENFDYTSSIDGETYNKVKLIYENKDAGKREIYIAQSGDNINRWGVLQYFESIDEKVNGKAKADALLSLYNQKTRNLSVSSAFGDLRVRAGSLLPVSLDLGDIIVNNYLLAEKVKHTFKEHEHTMDLTLRGGEFIV